MATPTFILPSAPTYTEGFVNGLNVYPNPTNFAANQVPFTRATTATRTNAAGLIELTPYNLVQYSEQFGNVAWVKQNSSITLNTATAPNGTLTSDTFTGDGILSPHNVLQSATLVNGTAYTFSVYAKKDTNNFIQITGGGGTFGGFFANFDLNNGVVGSSALASNVTIQSVGNGWYRCSATATSIFTGSGNAFFLCLITSETNSRLQANTLSTSVFIWGAQLVEGTDALPYQLTETRLNRPRVDFSLGGCPNLLLEPQRTNLVLWSEDFTNVLWTGFAGVTANDFMAPNGTLTADTLTDFSTTQFQAKQQNFTITPNAAYTASFFVRKTTGALTSYPGLTAFFTGTFPRIIRLILNTTTGTFNYEVSGVPAVNSYSATMTSFNADYWKVTLTVQDNQSNPTMQIIINPAFSTDGTTISAAATGSATFWGAQLELGAYPTSYIPTSSASVTRNTDTFQLSNVFTNNLISSVGGTWFVDLRNNIARNRDVSSRLGIGDNITMSVNSFAFIPVASLGRLSINKYIAGVLTTLYTTTANTSKIAIKWNGTTADVFENGVKVVTATPFTSTALEYIANTTNGVPLNINSMALYNTPLSDDECIAKTL
jgi:hypothetical protein